MRLQHLNTKNPYTLDDKVYNILCENYCLLEDARYLKSINQGYITLTQLAEMSRSVGLPYSLFFASYERVEQLIKLQNKELFGVLNGKYIVGTRGKPIDVRWIRRIILDLSRKQKIYNQYRKTDRLQNIVGFLKTSKRSIQDQAEYIIDNSNIDLLEFRQYSKKSDAFNYLRRQLTVNNIHVSVEARNYMPQSIPEAIKSKFSGIYIRDMYNPYLFVCNELSGSPELGSGRKIYTLLFLLVCLFKDYSYAVSIDRENYSIDTSKLRQLETVHKIVNEILMPLTEIEKYSYVSTYSELEVVSRVFNVTPKAALQRLYDSRVIKDYKVYSYLSDECSRHFAALVKKSKEKQSGGSPGAPIMILYYQGDFVDFLRNNVPQTQRKVLYKKHVTFNRIHQRIDSL